MNEDSKLILEELAKVNNELVKQGNELAKLNKRMDDMEERLTGRMDEMDKRFNDRMDVIEEKLNTFYDETTANFASVDAELISLHNLLSERINDVDDIVTQNCKDIARLRSKLA